MKIVLITGISSYGGSLLAGLLLPMATRCKASSAVPGYATPSAMPHSKPLDQPS